jgi:hypothetical protein
MPGVHNVPRLVRFFYPSIDYFGQLSVRALNFYRISCVKLAGCRVGKLGTTAVIRGTIPDLTTL